MEWSRAEGAGSMCEDRNCEWRVRYFRQLKVNGKLRSRVRSLERDVARLGSKLLGGGS